MCENVCRVLKSFKIMYSILAFLHMKKYAYICTVNTYCGRCLHSSMAILMFTEHCQMI